jgi:hypothetical protein
MTKTIGNAENAEIAEHTEILDRITKIFQDEERNENDSFPTILLNLVNPV